MEERIFRVLYVYGYFNRTDPFFHKINKGHYDKDVGNMTKQLTILSLVHVIKRIIEYKSGLQILQNTALDKKKCILTGSIN